ncbi:hypothetical protein CEXT_774031 [Caerostris extrusa]|uniref:Uncharacterized protein n=1 Tax=Caerostris extrusa TaxID=172846 RepID=A0AAV4RG26_CAEEX|nr:hypothetical protein CEXT_774031 [Caerostris extrusa]
MHLEVNSLSMNQPHSSWQHNILSNMDQGTDCEETAAAAVSSQFGVGNQNSYNPETSEFLFPGMPRGEENQTESPYFPFEAISAIMNKNLVFRSPESKSPCQRSHA